MHRRRRRQSLAQQSRSIPVKANRVLNIILVAFVLIILRIWHLSVVQHEAREEESRRPQSRTVIESAKRGTIVDRFGQPLAINRLQYNAALVYAPLRQIPRCAGSWMPMARRSNAINDANISHSFPNYWQRS